MRPVHNIAYKLWPERQHDIAAVDVPRLLLIHDEQVIAALAASNIDVFAQFNVALSSKDKQAPIAPRPEAIRSEPIHADISRTPVAMKHHVTEILEVRLI